MGEAVKSAGEISDGENGWREGGGGTNGPKTQLAADTQGQRDEKSERQTERGRQGREREGEMVGSVKMIKIEGVRERASAREMSRHHHR